MNIIFRARAAALALAILAGFSSAMAVAQSSAKGAVSYPARPVRIIVPFAPGGPTDLMARLIGARLTEMWSQQVIVDNRPGASANIAIGLASRAAPDGHSMLLTTHAIVVNPSLHDKLPWDPLRDFIPVTNTATAPNLMIANAGFPAKTLKDLVALVKANPGKYGCGTPGAATSSHLTLERLRLATGIDLQHVPYGGAGPVVNAVLGNQVPMAMLSSAGAAVQVVQTGRARAIVTTGARRSPALPDVPTLIESGYDFVAESMNGIFVPAGTPAAVVARMHSDIVRILQMPEIRSRMSAAGFEPRGDTREAFTAYVKAEIEAWSRVIREAGIKPE